MSWLGASNSGRALGYRAPFRLAGMLLCATVAALALPSHTALERDCITASLHARPTACASLDLDGDSKADFAFSLNVAGSADHPAAISIHLSRASKAYQLLLPQGLAASSFILRDVNGDGRIDIALLGGLNQTVGVFLNDGLGAFEFDRQERYLTAPDRDVSEISAQAKLCPCELAESSFGSDCTAPSVQAATHDLTLAKAGVSASGLHPMRPARGSTRSRAP